MKKIIITYGLIAGSIVTAMMVYATFRIYSNPDFKASEVIGYTSMLVAFAFIFIGIKQYRDKNNNGVISFKEAFKIGFFIALIASVIYTVVWLFEYHFFFPDFMEKYSDYCIKEAKSSGISEMELQSKMSEMQSMKEWYKNPIFMILITLMEILPLGVIITLVSALILRKKVTS